MQQAEREANADGAVASQDLTQRDEIVTSDARPIETVNDDTQRLIVANREFVASYTIYPESDNETWEQIMARRLASNHPLYIPVENIPIRQRTWYPYGLEQIPPGMHRVQLSSSTTDDSPIWDFDEAFCRTILDGRRENLKSRPGKWILNMATGRPEQLLGPPSQDGWSEYGTGKAYRSSIPPVQYQPYSSSERENRRDHNRLQYQVSMGLVSPTLQPAISPLQLFRESRERQDWLNEMAQISVSATANSSSGPYQPNGADDYEPFPSVAQTPERDPPPSLASSLDAATLGRPRVATAPSAPYYYPAHFARQDSISMTATSPTADNDDDDEEDSTTEAAARRAMPPPPHPNPLGLRPNLQRLRARHRTRIGAGAAEDRLWAYPWAAFAVQSLSHETWPEKNE